MVNLVKNSFMKHQDIFIKIKIPSGTAWQIVNAFPIVGAGHEQIGMWLDTVQMAPTPQVPGQGSWHLVLIQACDFEQSVFTKHSGWQLSYGFPLKSGRHSQYAVLSLSLQYALIPHGEGLHGLESVVGGSGVARIKCKTRKKWTSSLK